MSEILNLPMNENDAGAGTIKDYLKALLSRIWEEGEGFSGKRPFGNSGWEFDLYFALVKGKACKGTIEVDEDGYEELGNFDHADTLIFEAIESL